MANKSFRARLGKLFATQVVVRRIGKNKVKIIDSSKLQSTGQADRGRSRNFSGAYINNNYGYYTNNNAANFLSNRVEIYRDYEFMDEDTILSSALDIFADEITGKNPEQVLLEIKSSNRQIKEVLEGLFYNTLNIEFNLWSYARNMVKYGDFFLALDLDEELGIVNVHPLGSYGVQRFEGLNPNNPYEVEFHHDGISPITGEKDSIFAYWEIAHFRILSDTNFLPYGRSMLEGARKEFKRLTLMEDAMMIHRIIRAPQRRVYKIAVGNLDPNEVENFMSQVMDKTKKVPYMDEKGQYNLRYNLQNMVEDIYVPTRGGAAQTEVETLDGADNKGFIEDVEYCRNRMMAGLKIPKAFLGYDDQVEGKAVLAAEEVRFAKTIERLQAVIESELTKLAIIHLHLQGYEDASLVDFELKLHNPSIVYERQRVEILNEKIALAQLMKDSKLFPRDWIYREIFGLTDDQVKIIRKELGEDQWFENKLEQIANEGNDPEITGIQKGTAQSVAELQVQKDGEEGENTPKKIRQSKEDETRGRPKEPRKFGRHADKSNGRDPLGFKNTDADSGFTPSKMGVREITQLKKDLSKNLKKQTLKEILDSDVE